MGPEPKPFQKASIDLAVRALLGGSRRFLVADEVGLGKTIVASGVIQRLSHDWKAPLTVFYVCSNSLLAHQNLGKLAAFLSEDEREKALAEVDRPSLMPASEDPPSHPMMHLYSLSPGTALARGGGRMEERAFAAALMRNVLGCRLRGLESGLRLSAGAGRFKRLVRRYRERLDDHTFGDAGLSERFRRALREVLRMADGQHLPARLMAMIKKRDFHKLASKLRAALAIAALGTIRPDLVIFDEFQRFRDLVDPEDQDGDGENEGGDGENEAASRVLRAIRGRDSDPARPAILLLSATPYVPYRNRGEGGKADATADFYKLVKFLAAEQGEATRVSVAAGFTALEEELRKGIPDPARVARIRAVLEADLRPYMCRTERLRTGQENTASTVHGVDLLPQDVADFRAFAEAVREHHPEWAVPLWSSVPVPMQTLGQHYLAWRDANWSKASPAIVLSEIQRNMLEPLKQLPHPRLRALVDVMPRHKMGLPWISPSRPWWPLKGAWAQTGEGEIDGKLLVFSRYHATPAAVAGLLSYLLEAARHGRSQGATTAWDAQSKRRLLAARSDRPGMLALFHPSPLLTGLNPLAARGSSVLELRRSMVNQLTAHLARLGVSIVARGPRERPLAPWQMIAALEERAGLWGRTRDAWRSVVAAVQDDRHEQAPRSGLQAMVDRWHEARTEDVAVLHDDEVDLLAEFALDAPGIVLGRALGRHCQEATLAVTAELSWRKLRAYFDNPLFAGSLGSGHDDQYPDALRRAIRDGNLESVLDEHFWYLSGADARGWEERLKTFGSALRLRAGSPQFHESAKKHFRLRAHAAVAMTEARAARGDDMEEGPVRPDEVRQAFNTPFWPHILVTTSVGQEGLDFHPWCRAVAHWDPPAGPVSLEQREGRIARHGGLNVRRALGTWAKGLALQAGESPWTTIARRAEAELSDAIGLRPWWTVDGSSNVQRVVLAAHASEIEVTMSRLARERALYRLVLGMPDQADLLELLLARDMKSIDPRLMCIDLMAMRGVEGEARCSKL